MNRLWPRSLLGQILLALALALLLAQTINAVLLYRSQAERRETMLVHAAAFRLYGAELRNRPAEADGPAAFGAATPFGDYVRARRIEVAAASPLRNGERRLADAEGELRQVLSEQGVAVSQAIVFRRAVGDDEVMRDRVARRAARLGRRAGPAPEHLLVAAIERQAGGPWEIARVPEPAGERGLLSNLLTQTMFIYAVLVGAMALILRRITRPLAALTTRVERFAETRDAEGQLAPEGPEDIRRLIVAHNAMEARITALLDEKDVMLGAIGHDLKTPLTALRVRIESVEDEDERARMAATIEDIVRTLDDILSLARVGRPSDPREPTELSALVASVVEEYEDMGDPVTLGETTRLVLPMRATWLRRALRNLIGNALRYGRAARVSLAREGRCAVVRIDDDGPGIAPGEIARMLEPFTRGEPSRNTETGGAGLGLTLARAIAEQHGGTLHLANRTRADGTVAGLTAEIRLPLG
ncbi:MAG: two-component sensor histidine kinase [Novosphingobium sp.]|nr:two-component sensor histidine kinase [Novosphingobium sp.]